MCQVEGMNFLFFFFQAEDGIRDGHVTGVQTCALPISADGQPLYRDALARAIGGRPELELVGEAGDGRQALDAISASSPDVALIGSTLDGLSGEQVLNAVARDRLGTRVLMMAARPEPSDVYAALADGAAGYLTKDADARELCDAITAVARGGKIG